MKNAIKYILIGFIQGITEFLPVSSSGHIVLFGSLFELDNLLLISVVAHIGTLFAVIFCYRKRDPGLELSEDHAGHGKCRLGTERCII